MKFKDEDIIKSVKTSFSIAEVLRKLNTNKNHTHYRIMRKHIKRLNLDTSHFKYPSGQTKNLRTKPIEYYLTENSCSTSSSWLRKRLIREKIFENKCDICNISEWRGNELSLHLDHIDGNPTNNTLQNLRLLCPNCHSQTSTYCGKSRLRTKCQDCGIEICKNSSRCIKCKNIKARQTTKIKWPPSNELQIMINESSFYALAKKLGVSDNAIRKRLRKYPPTK